MNITGDGGGSHSEGDRTGDAADELLAQSRVEDAVQRRRRERWRAERRIEETTLIGALLGAASTPVTLHLEAARTASGTVTMVGHDVVEVVGPRSSAIVALDAIAAVETDSALAGDPSDRSPVTLIEALDERVHDGNEVTVTLRTGSVARGALIGVGESLVLRIDAPGRRVVIPLGRVALVSSPLR